jgi:hypothetical protein
MRHLRERIESRNIGFSLAVSLRALIMGLPSNNVKPHLIAAYSPPLDFTATISVGNIALKPQPGGECA